MRFIELHEDGSTISIWVNPQKITTLAPTEKGGTRIVFNSPDETHLFVKESPQEVLDMITMANYTDFCKDRLINDMMDN